MPSPFHRFSPTERKIVKVGAVVLLFVILIVAIVLIIGAAKDKNRETKEQYGAAPVPVIALRQ